MFCCAHDPGMAFFLAETTPSEPRTVGPLEWTAFAATILLALIVFAVPS